MPTKMMLWEVVKDQPMPMEVSKLDLEDRLESWIEQDIRIINEFLLVIGRQIETDYGGVIDLLGFVGVRAGISQYPCPH